MFSLTCRGSAIQAGLHTSKKPDFLEYDMASALLFIQSDQTKKKIEELLLPFSLPRKLCYYPFIGLICILVFHGCPFIGGDQIP